MKMTDYIHALNQEIGLRSVTVNVNDGGKENNSMEDADFIDIEKTPGSSIMNQTVNEQGVDDYYKIVLPETGRDGDYIVLRFPNNVDLDMYLLDDHGNTVAKSLNTDNFEGVSVRDLTAGTYYIRITAPFAAVGEYILTWNFTFNDVPLDALETLEPYAITSSAELTDLTISPADLDGATQEDVFKLTLTQAGNANSKIRFSNYRNDWTGLKYDLKLGEETVLSGIGAEISLDGLAVDEYTLIVDTPIENTYGRYDLSVSLPETPAKKWTYMVYFASDNNLGIWSLYDLVNIQQATINAGIEVYVLFDRPSEARKTDEYITVNGTYKWDSPWYGTKVGKVNYSPGMTVTVDWDETWGEVELNTGSEETLERFVNWVRNESPSDNYGLIMWDHGSADGSLCFDEKPGDDSRMGNLTISDVANVLNKTNDIPIVIFNNCLLGSEIVATQMTGATDVIVVSEPVSFAASTYNYKEFFNTITADMTPQDMAEIMVRNVQHESEEAGNKPTMLSSIDVTDTRFPDALEALANAVATANNRTDKIVLAHAMKKAAQDGCLYESGSALQADLYDMILQAIDDRDYEKTSEEFRAALANLKKTFEDVVLAFRSLPSGRGYGIAYYNVISEAMKSLSMSASANKTAENVKSYLDSCYGSNPAWANLLYEVCWAYLMENRDTVFRPATFSVTDNSKLVKGRTVRVSDLGCFSGQGTVFDGITLIGDCFFHLVITDIDHSTGTILIANGSDAVVTASMLTGDGSIIRTGTDSVSFSDLPVGDYYIRLQSETDCDITMSFEADWTGADRFDYAVTGVNDGNVDGNGIIEKAMPLSEAYYPGLLTCNGDRDLYRIGNDHTDAYTIVVESDGKLDVSVCDENMMIMQIADNRKSNIYLISKVEPGYYLSVMPKASAEENKAFCYSVYMTDCAWNPELEEIVVDNLVGTPDNVSWKSSVALAWYSVEFSKDGFKNVFQVKTNGLSIDTPDLPIGTYQWRVIPEDDAPYPHYGWIVGEEIVSENDASSPKAVQSEANGNNDIFFASPYTTWSRLFYAKHVGFSNGWNGTNEIVSAAGKGRIQNLYFGSADPNMLCLTDNENGDAIFLDDVYTELPENINENMARLSKIETILAGGGNDIVDMTSQQFAYIGGNMIIRGGDGDDVIWANVGGNQLFGDAGNDRIIGASGNDVIAGGIGNDRMHGGGGDDIFTFCDNWGNDTVEQTADGRVTLWFMDWNPSNWDESTLTYTDGENSVTVSGVSADKIELRFAYNDDETFTLFKKLFNAAAFDEFSSRKIFDEEQTGYLANI